jgi:hypothetical protein
MKTQKLSDLDNKVPFSVPEGYFDELTVSIQNKIHHKPHQEWVPQKQLRWALASAAMVILVAVIWIALPSKQLSAEQLLAQVSEEDLMAYLDIQEISEDDLLDGVNTEIIDQLWTEDDVLDDLNMDDLEIEDILLEYEIDINLQES